MKPTKSIEALDASTALSALVEGDLRYVGSQIVIDCASHSDAIERVRNARAALARPASPAPPTVSADQEAMMDCYQFGTVSSPPAPTGDAVAGPVWQDENGDWTAEVQLIGGHNVLAHAYGQAREEAVSAQAAIAIALGAKQGLFEAIQHGDEEHRAWLKAAIDAHFASQPVPPPQGRVVEEWRPIETAPNDGAVLWVLDTLYGKPWHYECIWNGSQWYHGFGDAWPKANPTHWRPLPKPPALRHGGKAQG